MSAEAAVQRAGYVVDVRSEHLTRLGLLALYVVTIVIFVAPMLWVLSLSLKTSAEIFAWPPKLFPAEPQISNYVYIWTDTRIAVALLNSVKITIFSVVGCLLVSIPSAYAFSRMRIWGKGKMLIGLLAFQMISPLVIAIPLYRYFNTLGLLDSHFGVILVYITVEIPFTVWLLKGFFDSIPTSLDEAARIDGCSRVQSLWHVLLPLAMPGIAAAIIFNVIAAWSQFIVPFILLSNSNLFPISVGVLAFQQTQTEGDVTTQFLAAASIMAMVPALIVFVLLQRFVVQVLMAGSVKG